MLDAFEIITTSGIVLWRKHYIPLQSSVINNFIRDVFIEMREDSAGRTESNTPSTYKKDSYTFTYTTAKTAKGVRLIFVAVDQSLRPLLWANDLATAVSGVFTNRYTSKLDKPVAKINTSDFDQTFEALVRKFGQGSTRRRQSETDQESLVELTPPSSSASATDENEQPPPPPVPLFKSAAARDAIVDDTTSADITPVATPDTSRPTTPLHPPSHLLAAKAGPGKQSRRARKAANAFNNSAPVSSGDDSDRRPKSSKSNVKSKRRWGADGMMIDGDDDQVLDYSEAATPNLEEERLPDVDQINTEQMGSRTKQGLFVLKDLEDEVDAILAKSKQQQAAAKVEELGPGLLGSTSNKITGFFKNLVGGTTMSKEDLKQPLAQMREHLIKKNVAQEAADRLCKIVEADLLNQQTASFTSIDKTMNDSMTKALTRILTPSTSLDLLRDINKTIEEPNPRPYIISIVGVNGVGKSTNLSKLAYFLLQNKFRILIAACDTFRSGAVEQLRVHVRNLEQLSKRENAGHIELFEKGYGKDAAEVAKQAIDFATNAGRGNRLFDVVLIDTAGRRHNDKRLMSSLTKFGRLANPDKIFMVGEALVGTDSIAQARHFAEQFVDAKGAKRHGGMGMDGFIISKCDAVGDMVGTLVSMVHATDIPVVFLGVGQHYGDLRGLNVEWAVSKLMK